MAPQELGTHPMLHPSLEGDGPIVDVDGNLVTDGESSIKPPTELAKVSLPEYRLAPPDVLLLQGVRLTPKAPYQIQSGDVLQVIVPNGLVDQPIAGQFGVDASGMLNLGAAYDQVRVEGLTVNEATDAVVRHLARIIPGPQVSITLLQPTGLQQVFGETLIALDGTVNLGIYGKAYVAGMTVDEAREAIELKLSEHLEKPKVSVDVLVYNSKYFYIITEGAGFGDNIVRVPVTGNETVLDAIAQVGGLQQISSKKIWISRPAPTSSQCDQVLPVDYAAITRGAATSTNYQLFPGDRVFIAEDRFLATQSFINKVINPVERMFGFSLLGAQTIQFMQRFPRGFSF